MKHVHCIQWQENDVFGAVAPSFWHIDRSFLLVSPDFSRKFA